MLAGVAYPTAGGPEDLPSVVVRIDHIAAQTAVCRCISMAQDDTSCFSQAIEQRLNLFRRRDVVGQHKCCGTGRSGPAHVLFECTATPSSQH